MYNAVKQIFLFFAAFILAATGSFAQSKTGLHLVATFHIAGAGGWDYLEVNPFHNWLYVSHGTQVNIVDKKQATLWVL